MKLEFLIHCIPPKSTHQASACIMKNKYTGKQFVGKPSSSKGAMVKNELMLLFALHRPAAPFKGPLRLKIIWMYPYRKSEALKRIRPYMPCDTRPDADNLEKLVMDVMTRLGFYNDDGQVSDLRFIKCWNKETGIAVTLEELT